MSLKYRELNEAALGRQWSEDNCVVVEVGFYKMFLIKNMVGCAIAIREFQESENGKPPRALNFVLSMIANLVSMITAPKLSELSVFAINERMNSMRINKESFNNYKVIIGRQ